MFTSKNNGCHVTNAHCDNKNSELHHKITKLQKLLTSKNSMNAG